MIVKVKTGGAEHLINTDNISYVKKIEHNSKDDDAEVYFGQGKLTIEGGYNSLMHLLADRYQTKMPVELKMSETWGNAPYYGTHDEDVFWSKDKSRR